MNKKVLVYKIKNSIIILKYNYNNKINLNKKIQILSKINIQKILITYKILKLNNKTIIIKTYIKTHKM